jgi:hypothetical protein
MMKMAAMLGSILAVAGCTEKLEGTKWKGQYLKDSVTLDFVSSDHVKCTWSRDWSGTPMNTTSEMTYSVEGKLIYLKTDKVTGKVQLENGELVGKPVDFGFENLDSTARVAAKRVR